MVCASSCRLANRQAIVACGGKFCPVVSGNALSTRGKRRFLPSRLAQELLDTREQDFVSGKISMQVNGTPFTSPYAVRSDTVQGNTNRAQGASSAYGPTVADPGGGDTSAGVSTYDFTNMSPAQMRSTVNDLIRSGKMSLHESTGSSA